MKKEIRKQIKKEVFITCALYIFYFLWWFLFAFGLGKKDVKDYTYILGFPDWFFYSCILGFLVFSASVYLVIKFFFKEIPLDEDFEENSREEKQHEQ